MKVDFNGFNENVLTFEADSSVTEKGQWVQLSDNGTVEQATSGTALVGVTVNVRGGFCAVKIGGTVTAEKSGDIDLGYGKLIYTDEGIAQGTDSGREHLVLSVDSDTVTFIL
ncbi:MAG: hypothetical protein II501_05375 [Clostridia bacterium]|jgi:hypothetical protein|nr:hypothetical protein [Clostridia bacterium]